MAGLGLRASAWSFWLDVSLLFSLLLSHPRRLLALVALLCVALLSFGLYLQHVVGLEPCPMCIVQRYVMVLMALVAAVGAVVASVGAQMLAAALVNTFSGRCIRGGASELAAVVSARGLYLRARLLRHDRDFPSQACHTHDLSRRRRLHQGRLDTAWFVDCQLVFSGLRRDRLFDGLAFVAPLAASAERRPRSAGSRPKLRRACPKMVH